MLKAYRPWQFVLYGAVSKGIIAEYGRISHVCGASRRKSLCSSDCVAERKRFEPSVHSETGKSRAVRQYALDLRLGNAANLVVDDLCRILLPRVARFV